MISKRFRELANQATEYCKEHYKDVPGPVAYSWEDRFAQLIVADCCELTLKIDSEFIMREPYRALLDAIKEHFYGDDMLEENYFIGNEQLDCYIGQTLSDVESDLLEKDIAYRVWTKNARFSMEVNHDRVNVYVDDMDIVTSVVYG